MKLDSKYFDCIRVKPDKDRLLRDVCPQCDWQGCTNPAQHLAPRGRGREGQYFHFCLDHVRQYNKSYNYFSGMSDDEVASFQKAATTGHRPTWSMGTRAASARDRASSRGFMYEFAVDDPFGLFGRSSVDGGPEAYRPVRTIRNAERKCLTALDLDVTATREDIRERFKTLVKRHHPDSNGGDRRSEDKLREVIQAYNYLRQAGLC